MTKENNKPTSTVQQFLDFLLNFAFYITLLSIIFGFIAIFNHTDIFQSILTTAFGLLWPIITIISAIVMAYWTFLIIAVLIKFILNTAFLFLEKWKIFATLK